MSLILGADGITEAGVIVEGGCCPPNPCDINECGFICTFIQLLPSGPLWDRPKREALEYYSSGDTCERTVESDAASVVSHSIYTAKRLLDLIRGPLWESYRESSPETAFTTIDDWLDRLGWVDCFDGACRDKTLGCLTPYEIPTECGRYFCKPDIGDDLELAVKRGIILSLTRLQMGIIDNLDSINWVIEPLGSVVSSVDGECNSFSIGPSSGTLPRTVELSCPTTQSQRELIRTPLDAFYETGVCDPVGLPEKIWPAVLAAECIVRSIMPRCQKITITRTC